MGEFFRGILFRFRRRIHPDVQALIAVATGSGEAPLLAGYHIARCAGCRERMLTMRRQWQQLVAAGAASPGPWRAREGLLDELLALIQAWDPSGPMTAAAAGRRDALHRAVARRLACELEAQLGQLGAALAEPVREHEAPVPAMLARTSHLLSTFLGYRAAVRLSQAALRLAGSPQKR